MSPHSIETPVGLVHPRNRMNNPTVIIRLVCRDLPGLRFCDTSPGQPAVREPVYLGIQRGKTVQEAVPANRRQVTFEAALTVERRADGSPNFLGPYAHGKPGERFLYLSWCVKQTDGRLEMFRRAKVMLSQLAWAEVQHAARSGVPISADLSLTDERGGPLCATVRESHIRWRRREKSPRRPRAQI